MKSFEVVIAGAGHAGIEAALAAARIGMRTALITFDLKAIGRMACNPAIGGVAKGQLVREIDALGGMMGQLADRAGIQFRLLNTSKGPAVWGPRAQQDMYLYAELAEQFVAAAPHLQLIEGELLRFEQQEKGFLLSLRDQELKCDALVITSGTFLDAKMYTGTTPEIGGRVGEPSATALAQNLQQQGIEMRRLKTGTPMRIDGETLDYDQMIRQRGDAHPLPFSSWTPGALRNDASCWITRTNSETHRIIRAAFDRSPLFDGSIKGLGPRYCPGIEDKITHFPERDSHQLFAEPEEAAGKRIYLNGFNSSLPAEVQEEAMRTIPGLAEAQVLRFGYDVDYDAIQATQLHPTLELKAIPHLYFAGQVNGTSGYEEAAAQGLIAGANAALKLLGKKPLLLGRGQAYTGVLIDDLTSIDLPEPYRMFTSRAEYRLLLRQDNTEARLLQLGVQAGLVGLEQQERFAASRARLSEARAALRRTVLLPAQANPLLEARGEPPISAPTSAIDLMRRGEAPVEELLEAAECRLPLTAQEKIELWADELYSGYQKRQEREVALRHELEMMSIPSDFDYLSLHNLSAEGRQALINSRPLTLGQAQRTAGVRSTDLSTLLHYLRSK